MKKFLKQNIGLGLLIVLSGLIIWPLFQKGYFSHHDDLQVIRIFEMRKCLNDFQIPCRWVPDMGFGNGFPLFNYYGVLPYFLGAIFSYVVGYVSSAKIIFLIPLILGGISMYFLGGELFGKKAGFLVGVLFMFAPYRALDLYVRGAVAESFALSLIPLVFYFSLKLVKNGKNIDFLGMVLSLSFFLISHNIMTLIFVPVFIFWIIILLYLEKWKNIKIVVLGLSLGFGISAFFLLPAFFEKGLVQTQTLTESALDFRNHFVSVSRLFFDRLWGYTGASKSLEGNLSFQVGWPHWWLVVIAIISILFGLIRFGKKQIKINIIPIFLITVFLISVFMTHNKSTFIWEKFSLLSYVQFPWRFLSLSIFTSSLLGGYVINSIKGKYLNMATALLVIATIALNWAYFRPQTFYPGVTDVTKLSGESWVSQQSGSVTDFLPITASKPLEPAPKIPVVIKGSADISNFLEKSNSFGFFAVANSDATIDVPIFDFPNWTVTVNGNKFAHTLGVIGRIEISLPPGKYTIKGIFKNTPIRTVSNIVSVASVFFLALYLILKNEKNKKYI